ncbi:MAG: hypothetical protein ABIS50_22820 [Luteolibacter sp.]
MNSSSCYTELPSNLLVGGTATVLCFTANLRYFRKTGLLVKMVTQ